MTSNYNLIGFPFLGKTKDICFKNYTCDQMFSQWHQHKIIEIIDLPLNIL